MTDKQIRFTLEEKRMIARWIRQTFGVPDYDGFIGTSNVPEDMMIVYRRLFPHDWD